MTEQEIINVLKENKTRGVAFGFMPKEVKEWCSKNDSNLVYYSVNGTWLSGDNRSIFDMNEIVALPDSFQIKKESRGEWVEFKINKFGRFTDYNVDDDDHQISFSFGWHQWSEFLECSYEHGFGYTTFGGWQYESNGYWLTEPQVIGKEGLLTTLTDYNEDCRPAIPTKIRFWRENK